MRAEWTSVEVMMAYTLNEFVDDSRAVLKSQSLSDALAQIADRLSRLLANPDFVSQTFNEHMPPGKTVLHHDPELDFYVLAHVQEGGKQGKPHNHGASWAVYGNAINTTEMTEWRRANPESDDHAELIVASKYSLGPGQTKSYGPGVIHSTAHPQKAWVIRVTGTDLDQIPRYHFGKQDMILEKAGD
jgi:predicted metal-dependent enzyme (double-stranded beta helix superfamily)